MAQVKRKILFLCTGNSCRSQMAEAILRSVGGDRFEALSAGSHPAGYVHALAIEAMRLSGISMAEAESKSWDLYHKTPLDVVITVCDAAAEEPCPIWPSNTLTAHWFLPDPAGHPGTADERVEFAVRIAKRLSQKIDGLIKMDWSQDRPSLQERLDFLGEI